MSLIKYLQVGLVLVPALLIGIGTLSLAEDEDPPSWEDTDPTEFIRGDVNGDGIFNVIPDALYTLDYAFRSGPEPSCLEAADVDNDGRINALRDVLYLLYAGFRVGPVPTAPFPDCGVDPDPIGSLGCDAATSCP